MTAPGLTPMLLHRRSTAARRAGVATVEAAVVLALLLVPVLLGVWEVGRLIYCQQVVTNAAREGARLAAQGRIINRLSTPTAIAFNSGTPNVVDTIYQAMVTGGLTGLAKADITVKYAYDADTMTAAPPYNPSDGTKNQKFRVFVSIPFAKVRWISVGLVNPTTVSYTVDWTILVDDAFSVNSDLPKW